MNRTVKRLGVFKATAIIATFLLLYSCETKQNLVQNTRLLEDSLLLTELYAHYPNFYPHKFDTDTNNQSTYFYYSFRKTRIIRDNEDSINCTIYSGQDLSSGQRYSILIIDFKHKKHVIPVDIETGDGMEMLNETFTEMYKSISANQNRSKKYVAALLFDKMLREYLGLTRIADPTLVFDIYKPNKEREAKLSGEDKIAFKNRTKEYLEFTRPIVDSVFHFGYYNRLFIKLPTDKYLLYIDSFKQVFIVSISDDKVEFKFFNPTNFEHIYI